MELKIVTKDELWLEFEKAIEYGDFKKFKTRQGFEGYINRWIKNNPGKDISFLFTKDYHVTKCVLKI